MRGYNPGVPLTGGAAVRLYRSIISGDRKADAA